jgi:hypothetical protein
VQAPRLIESYNYNDIVPKRIAYVRLPIRLSQRSCRSVLYCIVLPVSNSSRVCNDCSWPSFMAFHFSIFKLSLVNNQGNRTNIEDKKKRDIRMSREYTAISETSIPRLGAACATSTVFHRSVDAQLTSSSVNTKQLLL